MQCTPLLSSRTVVSLGVLAFATIRSHSNGWVPPQGSGIREAKKLRESRARHKTSTRSRMSRLGVSQVDPRHDTGPDSGTRLARHLPTWRKMNAYGNNDLVNRTSCFGCPGMREKFVGVVGQRLCA